MSGIHDHVDDVHLFSLGGDPRYKDPECLVFWHDDFRAVVIPEKPIELYDITWGAIVKLFPLEGVKASGFIAPPLPRDIWVRPIMPWLKSAIERRDTALSKFASNPDKRFPTTAKRERQNGDGLTHIRISLPCTDEYDWL